ncbi:hypothetical protein CHCC20335_0994 [Bacillus paralicheniformis]|nr:hypothetical protein CHCC20335_0994 [Bacillus paralicheniformis]
MNEKKVKLARKCRLSRNKKPFFIKHIRLFACRGIFKETYAKRYK